MIPLGKVNEAYDTLNLARDASLQTVRDRYDVLKARLSTSQDKSRLLVVEEAFDVIERNEEAKRIQRESALGHIRSRSERELDGTLEKMTVQTTSDGNTTNRALPTIEVEEVKKLKEDKQTPFPSSGDAPAQPNPVSDKLVFEKLTKILKDESKFLRAVNVLQGVIKSIIDGLNFTDDSIGRVIDTVEVAVTSRGSKGGIPLANIHEDNRKAISKVLAVIESSPEFLSIIKSRGYHWRAWEHSVVFRNSLYDLDNFQFTKRCKELISVVDSIDLSRLNDESERILLEIEVTTDVLCSSYISKVIPGRLNEVKKTMTELYKLTRVKDFPRQFKDRIAEHQLSLAAN